MRIAVVGAYGVGMTVKCPRLPVLGETVLGSSFSQGPGGKGSNQAVAAARLGAEAVFLTAVGDDDFGREAKRLWAREGVDGSGVQVVPGQPTMVALILVEPSGDNRIVVAPGALDWLTPKRVRAFADQIAAADIVVVSMEIPLAAAL
ncbi:MAG: PfkB family carbohydrate kinase, partial [Bifidobacteriaceae bacterium]|nr:PfkB family carbohydrate kinase [Bifidobacteriaceae bacterium]